MGFVVEIQHRNGRHEYHKFEQTQAKIGRGYDCDVILNDPYVDIHHLTISNSLDGLSVTALTDDAVTRIENKQLNGELMPIVSGSAVTVGRTEIRILSSSHPVDEVLTINALDELLTKISNPWVVLFATLAFFALTGLSVYANSFQEFQFTRWLTQTLSPGITALAWVCLSALITRVVRSQTYFLKHWMIVLAALTLSLLFQYIEQIVKFNLGTHALTTMMQYAVPVFILSLLLWFQLRVAFTQANLTRSLIATGIAGSIVAYGFISSYRDAETFISRPEFETELLPKAFLWRTPSAGDEFLEHNQDLFDFPPEALEAKSTKTEEQGT